MHPRLRSALVAALLAATCRSAPAPAPAVSADTWAVVEGRPLTGEAIDKEFRRINDGARTLSTEEALTAKLGLLDALIIQDILVAKANALKLTVPESDLDKAIADARKDIPEEAFQQELARRNLTAAEMREGMRRELLAQKLIVQEVTSKVAVTDQEITDFFTANRAQFNLPEESYRLAQIVVTPVREAQIANRSGDDATTPQAAAAKVASLMERLKSGTPFATLAMDFSEDPESAPRGGDLGLVPLSAIKQAPTALREAALNAPPGTARVASQDGAHTIVYVVAHELAGQRELTTPGVRDQITSALRGRKEQLMRTAYLTAARTDATVVNYIARRVVEAGGAPPAVTAAPTPAAAR